jgi:hypothetical protein
MSLCGQEICINDLMNALSEELELECPSIPDEEKAVLIECMMWDILNRGDYLPALKSGRQNPSSLLFSSSSFSDVQAK